MAATGLEKEFAPHRGASEGREQGEFAPMVASRAKAQFLDPIKLSVLMPVYNERFLAEAAIRRVLEFRHPMVRELELVVVDDGSSDGTRDILRRLAAELPSMHLHEQERNQGKGAAIRRAIREATGEISVVQDADLEYFPEDWALLLRPFFEQNADAVYGSRFLSSEYHRVLDFWHTLGNRFLTLLSNVMTDLDLTDMETCYKMVRTELLKSIPIRSTDFSIEPELTAKLAKRGAVIYEVPIRYAGRTYQEGKKITARHGWRALWSILKWKAIDDIFQADEYGSEMLNNLSQVHQLNRWTADVVRPELGARVLEIGAGVGSITVHLLPRARYVVTDVNPHYLAFLRNLALGKPYLEVQRLDVLDRGSFSPLAGQFDTALCLNVLEHLPDPALALRNLHEALEVGGKLVVLVPQGQWLYSSLDRASGHARRFQRQEIVELLQDAGFSVLAARDFNSLAVPGWLVNGRVLKRARISVVQLKVLNTIAPYLKDADSKLPWRGLSLLLTAQKPARRA